MASLPLSTRLRNRRRELGYNQQRAAELAGISQPTISLIERGIPGYASKATIEALCEALDVKIESDDLAAPIFQGTELGQQRKTRLVHCPSELCPLTLVCHNGHEGYFVPYFARVEVGSTDDHECPGCRSSLVDQCPSCGRTLSLAQPTCEHCHAFIVLVTNQNQDWAKLKKEREEYRRQVDV